MSRHRVAVLLIEQVLPLDFAIPMHVLAREASEFYAVSTATINGQAVAVAGGLTLVPDGDLRLLQHAQTVIVPGYAAASRTKLDAATLAMLQACAKRGARMVSICSGAFAFAQAGLLDGLTVTTHWSLCDDLARQFPAVNVNPTVLFVDNGSVLTSGGVTAGVDLLLHMLRKDLGGSIANHVAKRIVMAPRREGEQAQFIETAPIPPGDDRISMVQQWMLSVLGEPITVSEMASKTHMSRRNFHRRFVERTASAPLAWLQQQRIGRTKELLETTSLTVEEIATHVGLGSPANLRQHFRRATSLSPVRYRELFSHG